MSTFLEFYQALLKFINYKLFVEIGFKYPMESSMRESFLKADGIYLDSEKMKVLQAQARKKIDAAQGKNSKEEYKISEEFQDTPEMRQLTLKEEHNKRQRSLFNKSVFLLNRETPIYTL